MNILEKILDVKKQEVKELRSLYSFESFEGLELFNEKPLSLIDKIREDKNISVIAEVKKASPSKGILLEVFDHMFIAETYFEKGASAVSVLTDKQFFQGNIIFLKGIAAIKKAPVLRKDFIIDPIQIYEAKANGADAVLLISEALSKEEIRNLTHCAHYLGLDVLLELHSASQLDKVDTSLNKLIGINNRNLENFVTDLKTTEEISRLLPDDVIIVSESGISKREDLDRLKSTKTSAVLVGEHFMKSENIAESLEGFMEWCRNEA